MISEQCDHIAIQKVTLGGKEKTKTAMMKDCKNMIKKNHNLV